MCRITIITDNLAAGVGLVAEHGFSAAVQTGGRYILFDTGAGNTARNNLSRLGFDGTRFDALVLSHGHYDHTGGLFEQSSPINADALFASDALFQNHLRENADKSFDYIGIPFDRKTLESSYDLRLSSDFREIFPKIYLSGRIDKFETFDADKRLYVEKSGEIAKDAFSDEQFLIIDSSKGLIVLTGCSHSGVINIIKHTEKLFSGKSIYALIGGFHLFRSNDKDVLRTAKFLKDRNINKIHTGHCTGIEQTFMLKSELENVELLQTGTVIEI